MEKKTWHWSEKHLLIGNPLVDYAVCFTNKNWNFAFRGFSSIRCWQWRLYNEVFQNLFNMILLDFIFSLSKKTLLKRKMQGWDVQYCGCHLSDGGKWKSIKPHDFWFRGQKFLNFFHICFFKRVERLLMGAGSSLDRWGRCESWDAGRQNLRPDG